MGSFVARRAAMLVAALLVSSFVIFGSLDLAPGDPLSTLTGGRTLPPEASRRCAPSTTSTTRSSRGTSTGWATRCCTATSGRRSPSAAA